MAPGSREGRRRGRLSRSGDFDRVFRDGSAHANRFLILYAFPRPDAEEKGIRLGVSVGRKIGGATGRNAVKRSLREAFWALESGLPAHYDYVVVARPDAAGLVEREGTPGVTEALRGLLAEAGRG